MNGLVFVLRSSFLICMLTTQTFLNTALAPIHMFRYFGFIYLKVFLTFPLQFLLCSISYLEDCCWISTYFIFPKCFLVISALILLGWKTYFIWFHIFWGLFYDLAGDLSWKIFCIHLKRMCVLPLEGDVFYRCLLDLVVQIFDFHVDLLSICST